MNKQDLIEDLLSELSYQSATGIPDLKNKETLTQIWEYFSEMGASEVGEEFILNLLNEAPEKQFSNPRLNQTVKYKDKDGNDKEGIIGNLLRLADDQPGREAAERALSGLSDEERDLLNKELGGEKGGKTQKPTDTKDTTTTTDDTPKQQEPEKGSSVNPNTQAGKDFTDQLSPSDSAFTGDSEEVEKVDSFNTEEVTITNGELSDKNDNYSDGEVKQDGLKYGYKTIFNKDGNVIFKPAPGNAGSMLSEIMSGEGMVHLDKNPNMSEDELTQALIEQVENTELGKQNGSKGSKDKRKEFEGKMRALARAAKTKHRENEKGISLLESQGKMKKPTKVRNFYGHEVSIQKQVELIESLPGPFYTKEGVEVPKEELIGFIKSSGGGENPSDTSTISIDEQGRAMVTFHSDKLSTADIQANSTPNKEYEEFENYIDGSSLPEQQKEQAKRVVREGNKRLAEKEEELKSAANQPAREMANGDLSQILQNAKDNKNADGTPSKDPTSSRVKKVHSTTYTKPRIVKYLPEGVDYDSATEEQKFKAYLDYMGDDDKELEPTEDQVKFLYRLAAQQGYDISGTLGKIREESLDIQRNMHRKLNETSVTLPSGKNMPLGDYIEGQNLIDKLHLNAMDGDKNESGVSKYPGLFNLNMGGVLVEGEQLKECLGVDDTEDFIDHFEVGTPEQLDEPTLSRGKEKYTTGRNIFVYAVTKNNKRIPVAFKTQRSKQGQSGKLSTTYQWHKEMQNCFKSNQ